MKLKKTVVTDTLENKLVLLDTESQIFIEVNDIGKIIMEYILTNESFDSEAILRSIKEQFEIEDEQIIKHDMYEFVNNLIDEGVLIGEKEHFD